MSAMMKSIPEEYAEYPVEAAKACGVPATTMRRHADNGNIPIYYINDHLVVKLEEAIAVLTSPEKTNLKTRMRVLATLNNSKTPLKAPSPRLKNDLFAPKVA